MGQPVEDLVEWSEVAAESDACPSDCNRVLETHGGSQTPNRRTCRIRTVWRCLRTENGYSVDAMLHNLIRTEAYGAP